MTVSRPVAAGRLTEGQPSLESFNQSSNGSDYWRNVFD